MTSKYLMPTKTTVRKTCKTQMKTTVDKMLHLYKTLSRKLKARALRRMLM